MMQQPPPGYVPPPVKKTNFAPLLIGCGVLFAILLVAGGVLSWFAWHAVSGVVNSASNVAQAARGAVDSAQESVDQAGASPDPAHAAAAGVAILKSLVNGGKGNVVTLSRDDLKTYLPASVGALARTSSDSSSGGVEGITGTSATGNYGDSNGSVEIDITDAANMSGLTSFVDLAMNAVQSDNDEGYEKTTQLGDVKVHEKWENSGKHSELLGIVGSRFAVSVTGNGVDMPTSEQAFQAVDIGKLEATAAIPAPASSPTP